MRGEITKFSLLSFEFPNNKNLVKPYELKARKFS